METRDSRGRFTKGNPGGGRPKKKQTFDELVEVTATEAVNQLYCLLQYEDPDTVLKASAVILDFVSKYYECSDCDNSSVNSSSIGDTLRYLADFGQR